MILEEIKQLSNKDLLDFFRDYHCYETYYDSIIFRAGNLEPMKNIRYDDVEKIIMDRLNGEKK